MKSYIPYSLLAAFAACGMAYGQTAYTDPVGYLTIPIPGKALAGDPPKLQLASQGLLPGDAIQYAGVATTATGTTVTKTDAGWVAGAYVENFVEITSGPLTGTFTRITASTEDTLTTADDITAAGAEPTFRIVKAFSIGALLGNPPDASVLAGGANANDADNMLILDAKTGAYNTIWYKNGGIGGTGWRASSTGTADAANNVIHPSDGLAFQRKQVGNNSLVVSGSVKTTPTDIWVEGGGASRLNILSLQLPVDQLTLTASGLYTGDATTGLKGGSNANDADNVLILDAATGGYDTIWYKNGGIGGTGWRASSTGTADAGPNIIPAGRAVLIQRKAGATFIWNAPAVTVAP